MPAAGGERPAFRYLRKHQGKGVVGDFRRLLQTGDISKLSPRLCHFLHQSCGYIAHYDLGGFRSTYAGRLSELLDGELYPLAGRDPRESPWREHIEAGLGPEQSQRAPGPLALWEHAPLFDIGYKDGLSASDVMLQVCSLACEVQGTVRGREDGERRDARLDLMRTIAEREGFEVSPRPSA
jgi:hypothetical protein